MVLVGTTNEIAVIVKCHGPAATKKYGFHACVYACAYAQFRKSGAARTAPAAPCATALHRLLTLGHLNTTAALQKKGPYTQFCTGYEVS